jgi:hypothetical protein
METPKEIWIYEEFMKFELRRTMRQFGISPTPRGWKLSYFSLKALAWTHPNAKCQVHMVAVREYPTQNAIIYKWLISATTLAHKTYSTYVTYSTNTALEKVRELFFSMEGGN